MKHRAFAKQSLIKKLRCNSGDTAHVSIMSQYLLRTQDAISFPFSGPSPPGLGNTRPGIPDVVLVHVDEVSPAAQRLKPVFLKVGWKGCRVGINRTLRSL